MTKTNRTVLQQLILFPMQTSLMNQPMSAPFICQLLGPNHVVCSNSIICKKFLSTHETNLCKVLVKYLAMHDTLPIQMTDTKLTAFYLDVVQDANQ